MHLLQEMQLKALNVSVITYGALKTKVITCNVNVVISVRVHWVLHRRSEMQPQSSNHPRRQLVGLRVLHRQSEMQTRDSSHRKADL